MMARPNLSAAKAAARNGKNKNTSTQANVDPNQQAINQGLGTDAMAAGEAVANKYIGPAQQLNVGLSDDQAQATGFLRNQAMQGLSAPEYQAARDQMNAGLGSALNTNMANLAKAQARGKVYGAAAAAQMGNALQAGENARINNEQQLFLKSGDVMRQGQQAYATQAGNNAQYLDEQRKFNIGEQDATTAAKLGAITNTAGIVQAGHQNDIQNALGADAIAATGGNLNNYNKAIGAAKAANKGKKGNKK